MEFNAFKKVVSEHMNRMVAGKDKLFLTGADKHELWECYLNSFPEEERQSHNCNNCRHFIGHYGMMVTITNGVVHTIWENLNLEEPYSTVAKNLDTLVKANAVRDVFVTREYELGVDKNGAWIQDSPNVPRRMTTWHHLSYSLPSQFVYTGDLSVSAVMGDYRTTKQVFKRALDELTIESIETVLDLIGQNTLYRGEQYKNDLTSFLASKRAYDKLDESVKDNWCWENFSKLAHVACIRNTAIGTLLVDISAGFELDECVTAYERIMAPENYKRPKAIVTKRMIADAQAKVEELGLMDSLPRRHAALEDISVNNVIFANRDAKKAMIGNVFDELAANNPVDVKKLGKVTEIGIEEFIKSVVPTATNIELLMENRLASNLVTLTAPVNKEAPHLFKWANNFGWTYNGGLADSAIKDRVKEVGGKVDGILRCSLSWYNQDDLDIHCVEPTGEHIYYGHKRSTSSSGQLDIDMNAGRITPKPVENIIWAHDRGMTEGVYTLTVNNFKHRGNGDEGFDVEIECNGVVHQFHYDKTVVHKRTVQVARFKWTRAGGVELLTSLPTTTSTQDLWGIATNRFHKVNVMMLSPNYWDEQGVGNKHYFFMLDECKNPEPVRGFFNEYLKNELNPHRRVFEALADKMKVPYQDHQLSGVGFSSTVRNSVIVKVDSTFSRTLKVNF